MQFFYLHIFEPTYGHFFTIFGLKHLPLSLSTCFLFCSLSSLCKTRPFLLPNSTLILPFALSLPLWDSIQTNLVLHKLTVWVYPYSQLDSLTLCNPCMHVFLLALLIVNWTPFCNANLMICSMFVNPCIDLHAHDKSRIKRQLTCNTYPKHY